MRRIFILVFFTLFLIGCSSITSRKEFTQKERSNLITLIGNIKKELKNGEIELLESSLTPSIKNNFVKKELQNIDFSKVNILVSEPVFSIEDAQNIVGFVVQDTTFYYDVEYRLENGEWKIVKFKERRR